MLMWQVVVSILLFAATSYSRTGQGFHNGNCKYYHAMRAAKCHELCGESSQCELNEDNEPVCVKTNDVRRHRQGFLASGCQHIKEVCNKNCNRRRGRQPGHLVCGRDGIIYPSRCHLRQSECLRSVSVGIAKKEFCESSRTLDGTSNIVVSFDHQCIVETASVLNINKLARSAKLEKAFSEALSKYRKWRRGSGIGHDSLHRALSVLHAMKILVEEGKLESPYKEMIDYISHKELYRKGSAEGLLPFRYQLDACQSVFLRSAAIVDAVQVLNETYGPVFHYSSLMNNNCLFSRSVRLQCRALDTVGPTSTVQWFLRGTELLADRVRRHAVDRQGDLIISKVRPEDLGLYTCMATSKSDKTRSSTVRLSADKCPCSFVESKFDRVIVSDRSLSCLSADEVYASNMLIANTAVDEVVLVGGNVENIDVVNSKVSRMVVSDISSLRNINIRNSAIDLVELTNITGVMIEFRDVRIQQLRLQLSTLTEGGFQNCYLANVLFSFSQLHNYNIQDSDIQGLTIRHSTIINSILTNSVILGLDLQHSSVSGLRSDSVSYLDNYLYGLAVEHSVFTNSELRNYTTIGSHRFNLTTINMTALDFRSIDATLIDDLTVNATYRNLQVANLTVVNATSYKTTFIETSFQNSAFFSATWRSAVFANSSLHQSSFDHVEFGELSIQNVSVVSTSFTNTLLSHLNGKDAVFEGIQLTNYTTVNATRKNMLTRRMMATQMTSLNALIVDEKTEESVYVDLVARGTKAINCSSNHVEYINSSFYNPDFNSLSFKYAQLRQTTLMKGSLQKCEFMNVMSHGLIGEDTFFEDLKLINYTANSSFRSNQVTKRMTAVGFHSVNAMIVNETTTDSQYFELLAVNTEARDCQTRNVTYAASTFLRGNMTRVVFNKVLFRSSTVKGSTFSDLVINQSIVNNIAVSHTEFTDTLLFDLVGQDAVFDNIVLDNYTTVNAVRRNMVTRGLKATRFHSVNATILNETTSDSEYINLMAENTTAEGSRTFQVSYVDSVFSGALMKDVEFIQDSLISSSVISTGFIGLRMDMCFLNHLTVVDSNFTNSRVHNLMGEHAVFDNIKMTNYTTVNATRQNMVTRGMIARGFLSINSLIVNETTSESEYNDLRAVNVVAVNSIATNVSYVNSTFTSSNFSNTGYRDVVTTNYQTVNCNFANCSFINVDLTNYVDINGVYVDVATSDVVYRGSVQNGTVVSHWSGVRETCDYCTANQVAYNNISLIDTKYSDNDWNKVTIRQWWLSNTKFSNGTYSQFSVNSMDSFNVTWERNTAYDVNITNVISIGTRISHNRLCRGRFVNQTRINQQLVYYEASGLLTENVISNNVTETHYHYADSVFVNSNYTGLHLTNGTYLNVFVNKQNMRHSREVNITTVNMTAIEWHSFDTNVENNLFQDVTLINSTQTQFVVKNDTWINTELENSLYNNSWFSDFTIVTSASFRHSSVDNTNFERFVAQDLTLEQCEFRNVEMSQLAFYNLKISGSTLHQCSARNALVYMADFKHAFMQSVSFYNMSIANMNSHNSLWAGIDIADSHLRCFRNSEGTVENFLLRHSVLAYGEFINNEIRNVRIHHSVVDKVGWNNIDGHGLELHDVQATQMQIQNTFLNELEVINVTAQLMQLQFSSVQVSKAVNFMVEDFQYWMSLPVSGLQLEDSNVTELPFQYGMSGSCGDTAFGTDGELNLIQSEVSIGDGVPVIDCAVGDIISDIVNVTTTLNSSDPEEFMDSVLEQALDLCLMKQTCSLSLPILGMHCPTTGTCFQIDYTCQPIFEVVNEDLQFVFHQEIIPDLQAQAQYFKTLARPAYECPVGNNPADNESTLRQTFQSNISGVEG